MGQQQCARTGKGCLRSPGAPGRLHNSKATDEQVTRSMERTCMRAGAGPLQTQPREDRLKKDKRRWMGYNPITTLQGRDGENMQCRW